jgi:hypothetical protein
VDCQRTAGGRIHFTHGWNEFATANQLKPGEGLIFTLASPRRFVVQILQLDQRRGRSEEDSEEYTNAWHKRKSRVYDDDDDDEFDFQVKKPHHVTVLKHDDRCRSESPKSEDRPVWSLKNSNRRMSDLVQQWARNRIAGLKAGRVDPYEDRKHDEKRSSDQQEEEEEEERSFIKKLPDSSSSKCSPYPFVVNLSISLSTFSDDFSKTFNPIVIYRRAKPSLLSSFLIQLEELAKKNLTECILFKMLIYGDHPLHHLRMLWPYS